MNQPPTVGRIVHYVSGVNSFTVAAIVTALNPDTLGRVSLTIFPKNGMPYPLDTEVDFSEQPCDFHWTWPPRV